MFIVLEGPDGSGKTSLAKLLVDKLSTFTNAVYTCEPTSQSVYGQQIRRLLKTGNITDVCAFSDLFDQDRAEHIKDFILPHLQSGDTVVCDRYKYSACVYQQLQGAPLQYLIERGANFLVPDIVFLLTVSDVNVIMNRIINRSQDTDIFETRNTLQSAIDLYKRIPDYYPSENIVCLDATAPLDKNLDIMLGKFLST